MKTQIGGDKNRNKNTNNTDARCLENLIREPFDTFNDR